MPALTTAAFFVTAAATLPQLHQTLTTGQTRDLSIWNLVLNMIGNLLIGLHGYFTRDYGLIAIGIWFTAYWSILFSLKRDH